jgi:hypothetical protein
MCERDDRHDLRVIEISDGEREALKKRAAGSPQFYAVLHHAEYRKRYAVNVCRELPRSAS